MKLLNYIERKSLIHSLNGASKLFCLLMWKYISSQSNQMQSVITEFTATMREFQVTMTENNRLLTSIADKLNIYSGGAKDGNKL